MGRQGPEDGGEGDAAQAFEALRAEVAALRRGMELIYKRQQDAAGAAGPAAVDYSPTLGGMAKTLQAVEGRLQAIEGKPAMALTPARFEADIQAAGSMAATLSTLSVRDAASVLEGAKQEFQGVLAGARARRVQQVWVSNAAVFGVLGGMLLWFMAAALPWGVGHRLAAALVSTGGRWRAAEVLMDEDSPATWDRLVRLSHACPPETLIDLCEAAMVVRTIPPGPAAQQAPKEAGAAAPPAAAPAPPPPPPPRGRVGTGH